MNVLAVRVPGGYWLFVNVDAASRLSPAAARVLAPHHAAKAVALVRHRGQLGFMDADALAAEGGTPEVLSRADLERFLDWLADKFELPSDANIHIVETDVAEFQRGGGGGGGAAQGSSRRARRAGRRARR